MADERVDADWFDAAAAFMARQVAHAWFFCACVAMVIIWAPSIVLGIGIDAWELIINTVTTIITFLLVALLQNTQDRSTQAVNHKLDAIANALADLVEQHDGVEAESSVAELRRIAGIEMEASK